MSPAGLREFPATEVIMASVAEGMCPECRRRLDPDVEGDGRCSYNLDEPVLAEGGCRPCNSIWAINATQWGHYPINVGQAGSRYGACTCMGGTR